MAMAKTLAAQIYMNIETGSTGTRDEWDYQNEDGQTVNAVDLGEVVPVTYNEDGSWWVEHNA